MFWSSHFKNQLIAELNTELNSKHHFTTAYSPWANGTVERVCKEILRACRVLCSEWKLAPKDWPATTESLQSVLNHAPLRRLGLRNKEIPGVYRCALEVFTGHLPDRPLMRALPMTTYKKPNLNARYKSRSYCASTKYSLHCKICTETCQKQSPRTVSNISNHIMRERAYK